jgi:hypothetical protein
MSNTCLGSYRLNSSMSPVSAIYCWLTNHTKCSVLKATPTVIVILWLAAQAGTPGQLCWSHLSPRAVTAIWWHGLPHMSGCGAGCQLSHICVRSPQPSPVGTGFPVNSRTEQAQCTSAFQTSVCVTFVMSHWPNHNRSWPKQLIGSMYEGWQIDKDTGIGIHGGGALLLEQVSVLWP